MVRIGDAPGYVDEEESSRASGGEQPSPTTHQHDPGVTLKGDLLVGVEEELLLAWIM